MSTDLFKSELIINQLTKEQYKSITPKEDELYVITDAPPVDIATVDKVGIVKPDGVTISITEDGTLSVNAEIVKTQALPAYEVSATGQDVIDPARTNFKTLDFLLKYLEKYCYIGGEGTKISIAIGYNQTLPDNINTENIATEGETSLTISRGGTLSCQSNKNSAIFHNNKKLTLILEDVTFSCDWDTSKLPAHVIEVLNSRVELNGDVTLTQPDGLARITSSTIYLTDNSYIYCGWHVVYHDVVNTQFIVANSNSTVNGMCALATHTDRLPTSYLTGENCIWYYPASGQITFDDKVGAGILKLNSLLYMDRISYSDFFVGTSAPLVKDITCRVFDKNGAVN